jgi:hypothetical protein
MDEILELYKEKNHFLKKFYLLNLKGLENFNSNKFENLEEFYGQREKILEIVNYIKAKIENLTQVEEFKDFTSNEKIREIEQKSELLAKDILKQDSEILALIEGAKNLIIKELQKIKKGKSVVSKYKGYNKQNNLDEEA